MYCKRCGAPLHEGVIICPECGARQSQRFRAVRCASCHRRVPLGLTVCPYCARTVRPAGPRWGLWLGAAALVVIAALWGLGKLPVERVAEEVTTVRARLSGWVQAAFGSAETTAVTPVSTPQLVAQATIEPTPTSTPAPIEKEEGIEPASLPEVSPTSEFSPTPEPTATPTPTEAPPTPTATPTLAPPTATPTRAPSGRTTYTVQSGDTLSTIAAKFGISWEALAAANGLTSQSVLRIGQALIVPVAGSAPPAATRPAAAQPTATKRPAATPTVAPTPTPALAAPVQVNPGDQASFNGEQAIVELVWEPVIGMPPNAQYQVIIRWLEQGTPQEHILYTTATVTRVPLWMWGRADQPARRYTWTVRVVQVTTDGQGGERVIPLSPASPARIFYWI